MNDEMRELPITTSECWAEIAQLHNELQVEREAGIAECWEKMCLGSACFWGDECKRSVDTCLLLADLPADAGEGEEGNG